MFDSGVGTPNAATDAVVGQAAAALKGRPTGTKVSVVGFADPQGNQASNLALSKLRADNVKDRLATEIAGATYTVEANGDTAADPNNLAQSRRVEITIG